MTVLFLIRTLGRGGAERQLALLAKELHRRGHVVHVAVLYGGGEFEQELVKEGIGVIDLEKKSRWDVLGFLWRYKNVISRLKPQILHGYMPMQNLLALLGRLFQRDLKIVWGIRDSAVGHGRVPLSSRAVFFLSTKLLRFSHLVISNSHAGRDLYASTGCPAAQIVVVPNGIDAVRFSRNENARQRIRAAWHVNDGDTLIACVGRLDPGKDHASFFRACAGLVTTRPELKLVCVGGGGADSYVASLKSLCAQLGMADRVVWPGECADMSAIYSALDLVVSASLHEGFPNVIAEAMCCEVPVVATDVGDVKLILDGVGVCVPASDSAALQKGIGEMLKRDLRETGKAGRRKMIEMYSVEKLTDRTEKLLHSLLV